MKYGRNPEAKRVGPQKRKLKTKPLLIVIGILFVLQCLLVHRLAHTGQTGKQSDEEVASVAGKPITREQWMTAMEKEVGRETLLDLVNEQVMADSRGTIWY